MTGELWLEEEPPGMGKNAMSNGREGVGWLSEAPGLP